FSKTPALSARGDARPFDAGCDGTILGEGLGVLALKRLDDARRDGDKVYAVIRGVGSSSDGKGNAVYAARSGGQARALRQADRHEGRGRDRGGGPERGLPGGEARGDVVRARVGQVADRPHQGGGGCRGGDQ